MQQFAYDAQLGDTEQQLFAHDDRDYTRTHVRAAEDLRRDLAGHGYFRRPTEVIIDTSARAVVTLSVTAGATDVALNAGTLVRTCDPSIQEYGDTVFATDVALIVTAGQTGEVPATAVHPGEAYNVAANALTWLAVPDDDVASITNPLAATGGADGQLTRAATYRALELICADLMRQRDDSWDHKRSLYARWYKEEVNRIIAAGLQVDRDGDGLAASCDERRNHGFHRFRRG